MKHFGENITLLRKKKGFTQEALAGLIGVSAQSVSKWENSTNMPDISLLPVLADIFQCSIDALFGRESEGQGWSPEEAFDRGCEGLLQVLAAVGYNPGQEETIAERLERYRKELREEENMRTGVFCQEGVAYYRDCLGGLLLKRPGGGWKSLFESHSARKVLELLCSRDFCRILGEICGSGVKSFTLPSMCARCGIQGEEGLGDKLAASGLFFVNSLQVDQSQVTVYELLNTRRLSMMMAVLSYAQEAAEYKENYLGLYDCGLLGGDPVLTKQSVPI